MEKLKELTNKCKCSVELSINNHKDCFETVEQYLSSEYHQDFIKEQSKDIYDRMIELDIVIELQFYPDSPNGFYKLYHYDIDKIIETALSL